SAARAPGLERKELDHGIRGIHGKRAPFAARSSRRSIPTAYGTPESSSEKRESHRGHREHREEPVQESGKRIKPWIKEYLEGRRWRQKNEGCQALFQAAKINEGNGNHGIR